MMSAFFLEVREFLADEKRFAWLDVDDFWWLRLLDCLLAGDRGSSLVWWFTAGSGARGYNKGT